ncbi:hypothetical protein C5167_033992 [Papaver somniferum]|uniref:DUF7950 domain-containing protein n=1 Tax=Papaver somniferum TaxID=3469 RepID=A0A4Y7KG09_PAPSO|nr:uncharacterized protein LOC113293143 [Papaver somniferum]RZC70835.1 hypothetical protein C5167_033992 [Papaver somniferum]
MDGRGGCCIARYDGRNPYDTSKIDRIMLRFRPIAPKPDVSGSVSGDKTSEKSDVLIKNGGRTKRRYVKDATKTRKNSSSSNNNNNSKKRRLLSDHHLHQDDQDAVVTLSLLPEKPTGEASSSPSSLLPLSHLTSYVPAATWSQNGSSPASSGGSGGSGGGSAALSTSTSSSSTDRTVVIPQPVRPVGSCVTVKCITETFGDQEIGLGFLGRTDEEKKINLEKDACPGFISDSLNRVKWTNEAYRKLVNQDGFGYGGEQRPEMVWLVTKDNESLPSRCEGFVCRVRLQYTCKKERHSLIVPCDVWKMNDSGGGFAWRLDVKAALSLGR